MAALVLTWVAETRSPDCLMRTLCLNLDQSDAEILRDAVESYLRQQPTEPETVHSHHRTRSLRTTLDDLQTMIDRPGPRPRAALRASIACSPTPLRRIK